MAPWMVHANRNAIFCHQTGFQQPGRMSEDAFRVARTVSRAKSQSSVCALLAVLIGRPAFQGSMLDPIDAHKVLLVTANFPTRTPVIERELFRWTASQPHPILVGRFHEEGEQPHNFDASADPSSPILLDSELSGSQTILHHPASVGSQSFAFGQTAHDLHPRYGARRSCFVGSSNQSNGDWSKYRVVWIMLVESGDQALQKVSHRFRIPTLGNLSSTEQGRGSTHPLTEFYNGVHLAAVSQYRSHRSGHFLPGLVSPGQRLTGQSWTNPTFAIVALRAGSRFRVGLARTLSRVRGGTNPHPRSAHPLARVATAPRDWGSPQDRRGRLQST